MLKIACAAIIAGLSVLAISCEGGGNAGAPGSETESATLRIDSAEWRASPEPRVVVDGEWGIGISTPPTCSLLEGEDGDPITWYDRDASVELDGGRFHVEFVRAPDSESQPALDPETEYYVRCQTNVSTGKTVYATAPIAGSVPGSQQAGGTDKRGVEKARSRGEASAILGQKII